MLGWFSSWTASVPCACQTGSAFCVRAVYRKFPLGEGSEENQGGLWLWPPWLPQEALGAGGGQQQPARRDPLPDLSLGFPR